MPNRNLDPGKIYEFDIKLVPTGNLFKAGSRIAVKISCVDDEPKNPLELKTEMAPEQLNNLRKGWDLIIDIDSKFLDYREIVSLTAEGLKTRVPTQGRKKFCPFLHVYSGFPASAGRI
jgi:hypothetical protein